MKETMSKVRHPRPYSLLIFLLVSLAVHTLFLGFLPEGLFAPENSEPESIEVVLEKPPIREQKPRPIELDAPPPPPPEPRTEPAKRLGPQTQVAREETAPAGQDHFDRPATAPAPSPPAARIPQQPRREAPEKQTKAPKEPTPSLEELTRVPPATLEQLTRLPEETVKREERKNRPDVPPGERLRLDMTEDVLISFYKRFSTHVLGAWNYPAISRQRNEQGQVETLVTVNKAGELVDLQLLNGSGYAALDEAALYALRRSAPYGPLSRHYPKPTHTFRVTFIYKRYSPFRN